MDFITSPKDNIVIVKRIGNETDPYSSNEEQIRVSGKRAILKEIPDKFSKVLVKTTSNVSLIESITMNNLSNNDYYVDYQSGIIYFHSDQEGKILNFSYKGTGYFLVSSNRVFIQNDDNSVQTAEDKFNKLSTDIQTQKVRIDTQINSVPQPSEVLDTRVDRNGNVYSVVKERIDAEQKKIEDTFNASDGRIYNSLAERMNAERNEFNDHKTDINNQLNDAKVESDGTINATLKDRLNKKDTQTTLKFDEVNAQLADNLTQVNTLQTAKADKTEINTLASGKADKTYVDTITASLASGSPKGVYATVSALQTAFPTGNTNIYLVTGNVKEVASLTISAIPTVTGNVTVTLNGVATNIAVDSTTDTTTSAVATKIRNATYSTGAVTGGTGSTVTFTASAGGVKTDATYSAGTTGATGVMTTTTQGVDADGKWYYWNGSAWTAGAVYQGTDWQEGITARNAVNGKTYPTLTERIKSIENGTTFDKTLPFESLKADYFDLVISKNILDRTKVIPNKFIDALGNVIDSTSENQVFIFKPKFNTRYYFCRRNSANTGFIAWDSRLAFLDVNMNPLSIISSGSGDYDVTVTDPNVYYLAKVNGASGLVMTTDGGNVSGMIVEGYVGEALNSFIPYSYSIKMKKDYLSGIPSKTSELANDSGFAIKGNIAADDTTFFTDYFNIYNDATKIPNYQVNSNGTRTSYTNDTRFISDYIEVKPSSNYKSLTRLLALAFYDSNKVYISNSYIGYTSLAAGCEVTSPSNAKYAVLGFFQNTTGILFCNSTVFDGSYHKYLERRVQKQYISDETKEISCIGDSLTNGVGGGGTKYPDVLATLSGKTVRNIGVGGENVCTIAARQGATPILINNITIPATVSPVQIATYANPLKDIRGNNVFPLRQGDGGFNHCIIAGVQGVVSITQTDYTSTDAVWKFTRDADGSEVVINRPTPIITDNMINRRNDILSIWVGQNGGYTDINDWIQAIKLMVDYSKCKEYIVLGLSSGTTSTSTDRETQFTQVFGRRFINLREYLVNYGLSDAGLTPTTQDNTDIANGTTPTSLRYDSVHLNSYGYTVVANLVYKRLVELGII